MTFSEACGVCTNYRTTSYILELSVFSLEITNFSNYCSCANYTNFTVHHVDKFVQIGSIKCSYIFRSSI